jgi:hypothetical protein
MARGAEQRGACARAHTHTHTHTGGERERWRERERERERERGGAASTILNCVSAIGEKRSLLTCQCTVAQALQDREVAIYSISCKNQDNIDLVLDWLTKHAKS